MMGAPIDKKERYFQREGEVGNAKRVARERKFKHHIAGRQWL
jgi:hypothetical protein